MRRALTLTLAVIGLPAQATTLGPLTELAVGPSGTDQRAPAIAYDRQANTYGLVFEEDRGGSQGGRGGNPRSGRL